MSRTSWNVVLKQVHSLAGARDQAQAEDAELLGQFLAIGDEEAFETLLRRHGPMVLRVARRVLRSEADAEDAFQATFLLLARKARSIRRRSSVASWLHGVAHRLALHARADRARRREREGRVPGATSASAWQELDGVLDEVLAGLPEKYRTPLVHCYLEGRTQEEVAQLLGAPLGTVRSWIARGRELLRKRLVRRGVTLSAAGVGTALLANAAEAASLSVSGSLAQATLQAAPRFAAGNVLLPSVSARVVALVRDGLSMLVLARLRGVAIGLLLVALVVVGAGFAARQVLDAPAATKEPERPAQTTREQAHVDLDSGPLPAEAVARLGTNRFRHEFWTGPIAIAPDDRAVFGLARNSLIAWDADTGRPHCLLTAASQLNCLAISPQGTILAAADLSGMIHLVDRGTGKEVRSWEGEKLKKKARLEYAIRELLFTPDGRTLISVACSGLDLAFPDVARSWDVASGKEVSSWVADRDSRINSISPDGKLLILENAKPSGLLRVVELATGKEVRRFNHPARAGRCVFGPDGKMFAVALGNYGEPGRIVLWDFATGKELATLAGHTGAVYHMAFSPDGKTLISGYQDQIIRVWDLQNYKEVQKSADLKTPIYGLEFFHDGKGFVSSGAENLVRVWDLAPLRERFPVAGPSQSVSWLSWTPDGRRLATGAGNRVWIWESATGKLVRALENHPGFIAPGALSADGKVLVSQGDKDVLHVWDPETGQERQRIETGATRNEHVALSPDGTIAATWGMSPDKSIFLWDTATGKNLRTLDIQPESPGVRATISHLCFTPDSKTLYACSGTHVNVLRWDVATGNTQPQIGPHDGGVNWIALAADGRSLAVATMGRSVYLWELATGQTRLILKNAGYVTRLAFSPDGRLLAAANSGTHSQEGGSILDNRDAVALLRVADGKVVHRFAGQSGGVNCLGFSPDGRTLASGGADTTTLVWSVPERASYEGKTKDLTPSELSEAWKALGGSAEEAHRAMGRLVSKPTATVPFLREHLEPVVAVPAERVLPLVKKLDSDQFEEREAAAAELRKLGTGAVPVLRKALGENPSVELRRRLEMLLEEAGDSLASPARLRAMRAIEVLERINDAEARALVKRLADGAEGAGLTEEAQRTWRRLSTQH